MIKTNTSFRRLYLMLVLCGLLMLRPFGLKAEQNDTHHQANLLAKHIQRDSPGQVSKIDKMIQYLKTHSQPVKQHVVTQKQELTQATRVLTLDQAAIAGFVKLQSKGLFWGDAVSITVYNPAEVDTTLEIIIRIGDILVAKDGISQNLIIVKPDTIVVTAGDSLRLDGLYTACIDANLDAPATDTGYDVAPPLQTWTWSEAAMALLPVLDLIHERELYFNFLDFSGQQAIWKITDNSFLLFSPEETRAFLMDAGIDTNYVYSDFPHLENPNLGGDETGYLIPDQIFAVDITPERQAVNVGGQAALSGALLEPQINGLTVLSRDYFWQILEAPEGSMPSVASPGQADISFQADKRGFYHVGLNIDVSAQQNQGGMLLESELLPESSAMVVATDAFTETFESGSLAASHFAWQTSGDALWEVSDDDAHTGSFSIKAGQIEELQNSSLEITVDAGDGAEIAFAYKTNNDFVSFLIDGEFEDVLFNFENTDWQYANFTLPAGEHTCTWLRSKDSVDFSFGGPTDIFIDDIFLPNLNPTGLAEGTNETSADAFYLHANYPNPFNPVTSIRYHVPQLAAELAHVRVRVFNLQGQQVQTLVDEAKPAGDYVVQWNGLNSAGEKMPSGMYVYTLQANDYKSARKMLLLK